MPLSREQICQSASRKLAAAAGTLPSIKATIGLDGFVDEIIGVVDKRRGEEFDAIPTIEAFGRKILAAMGQSGNFELVVKHAKLGGNGPIMANALAAAGLGVNYIGAVGFPAVHPAFNELKERPNVTVKGIAEPGHTDALEFTDGKLMLGKYSHLTDVNWNNLMLRVGKDTVAAMVAESKVFGFVNWTMLPYLSDIWRQLLASGFLTQGGVRRMFMVDLCDPEKRPSDHIADAMEILTGAQEQADVILGLNLKESTTIAEVIGVAVAGDPEPQIEQTAARIREKLNLSCVVVHPRRGAAAATATETASFLGPFVKEPKISTGAGDHFNAGFCVGRVLGLSLAESLCTGVATSGYYVRTGISPAAKDLADFIATLPAPQT
ncbi:MAG TPA: PfkB family carbohydrate kinase [Tepidisphaeraceae bacterium]|jgi:sugar/nucleoside kinase (ribokinase family)|nr:PfkB family carbohydrate kinase [Tepidisphaeraceae bacterium]